METGLPARLSPAEGRKFGFTVGLAFAVLAGITWWRGHTLPMQVLGGLAAALILSALLVPERLGPVSRGWMKLALLISRVTTPVFLAIVYFLVIGPIGVVMRLTGKNPLRHRPEQGSLWLPRSARRGTMSNQF